MEEEYHILPSSLLDKNIKLAQELDDVIVRQMDLRESDAPIEELAMNMQKFNSISQQILDDKTIVGDDRIILLNTISSYSNLFITSVKEKTVDDYIDFLKTDDFESRESELPEKKSLKSVIGNKLRTFRKDNKLLYEDDDSTKSIVNK